MDFKLHRYFLVCLIVFIGCSSIEPISEVSEPVIDQSEEIKEPLVEDIVDQSTEDSNDLSDVDEYPYMSSLSDVYFNRTNTIPEAYQRLKVEIEEEEVDLFEGYRVQIYSGPDVALADTLAKRFRVWSAERILGYQADTYTFFKPPNYRVHVGDFHDRQKAIEFSNLMKRRFRDSWVVYDRVNPYNVPADSVQITIN